MSGRLQNELKMNKPFASLEAEAFLNLVRTVDQLERHLAAMLKPFDLTMAQYNVLRILRGAGLLGLPCGEIATRLVTWDPDITRLLDRLERRGLVSRTRDSMDRRIVFVRLTPSGTTLLANSDLEASVQKSHQACLGHIEPKDLSHLIDLMENIRVRLEDE